MIRNYLLIAIRNFLRQRTQSILNVLGLAIGLVCTMYVFLYIHDELNYDTQHPDPYNTYRLGYKDNDGNLSSWALAGWGYYLKENLTTLAEILKERGYQTAAFIGAFPLDSQFGLNQGFNLYDDKFKNPDYLKGYEPQRTAEQVYDSAVKLLKLKY